MPEDLRYTSLHTGEEIDAAVAKISQVTASSDELNNTAGTTGNIQQQLDAKVPTSRTINGKALTGDITLTAADVGAAESGSGDDVLAAAKEYVDDKIADVEAEIPSKTSDLNNDSGFITRDDLPAAVTIDSALSSTSTNPVQNKVVTEAIDDLEERIDNKTVTLADLGVAAKATELNYVSGVTSNIQQQLDSKVTAVYSTVDLEAGVSPLATGTYYWVYE